MFFLARCLFWLTFVYLHLPATQSADVTAALFDMAGARATVRPHQSPSPASPIPEQGAEWCKTHGEACVEAVLAAMVAKVPGETAAGAKTPGHSAIDALSLLDRLLRLRG